METDVLGILEVDGAYRRHVERVDIEGLTADESLAVLRKSESFAPPALRSRCVGRSRFEQLNALIRSSYSMHKTSKNCNSWIQRKGDIMLTELILIKYSTEQIPS